MNVNNILAVADAIENSTVVGLGFNMQAYINDASGNVQLKDNSGHACKTTACIAGWAVHVSFDESNVMAIKDFYEMLNYDGIIRISPRDFAKYFFETDNATINRLVMLYPNEASPSLAVSVLRNLALTGVVDWDIALVESEFEGEEFETVSEPAW